MRIKDFTTRALALITMFLSVATTSATKSIGDVITVNLNGIDAYFTITGVNPNTVEMGRKHYSSYETFAKTCTLTDIEIPVTVTASDGSAYAVTSLCTGCFWVNFFSSGTTLKTVSMPPTVTSIGNSAFASHRGLESVEGLERVTTLGNTVFGGCTSLTTLDCLDNVETIGTSCFSGCKLIQSLSLPKVKSIPSLCFANCRALNNIYLPEAIEIGDSAFQGCRALKKIELPKVKKIGMWFFCGCSALEEVILGSNVESIEKRAFLNAGAVKTIHISTVQPPVWLGTDAYLNASGNDIRSQITVYVPVGCAATYRAATFWRGFKEFVEMEDPSPAIAFADANVKALCVANWDTNGDGELSEAEAAAVTDLGEVFKNDTTITSFNELQYFTGLTEIPSSAFYNCQYLNEVIIPENVTTIGINAFYCCFRLSSITVPEGVTTIDWLAFQGCYGLHSIHIPASVTNIGMRAFMSTTGQILNMGSRWPSVRESITVAEGNTVYDSRGNCNAIIETATNTLMYGCSNTIIPSGVRIIDEGAFANTALTSIVIPNSVDSISGGAFAYCKELISVRVESEVPIALGRRPHPFSGISANAILYVPAGSKAAYETAGWNTSFSEIVEMEDSSPKITNLLSNKWSGAEYSVQAATFDSGVNYGDWNDSNPNYNQIVGVPEADANGRNWYDVDYTCNWQEMTAPLNNWCQDGNFGDIYARRTFYYDEEMPEELFLACGHDDAPCEYYLNGELIWSVTDGWFEQEIYKLTSAQKALLRPGELNVLAFHVHQNYGGMYADCGLYTSLSEMGISNKCGDNLTWSFDYETGTLTISGTGDMYDFSYYSEDIPNTPWVGIRNLIKHIDVQDGATRIGSDAFLECSALTSVTLPNSVTSIGGNAFRGCTALTSVTIPEGVTTIGNSAFRDSGLETIAFPNSLTSILRDAFDWCMALTSITIPKSVTRIDASTFQGCQGLTSIIVEEGNPTYDSRDNCNAIIETATNTLIAGCQNTIIPESVTSIGGCAFEGGCTGPTTFINIPEGVTSIWCWGFHGCGLTSVTIPNSVTLIDHDAFQSCDIMTDLTIGSGVTNIRNSAFSYCSALTDVWCNAENVPTTENDAFNNSPIASATLHVPAASLEAYSTTAPWSGFGTIVPIEEAGIEVTDISQLENAIYIEPLTSRVGTTVDLCVKMKNTLTPVGCSFKLTLPQDLRLQEDEYGDVIYEMGSRAKKMSVTMQDWDDGSYDFALTPSTATAIISGNDDTFITFHVELPDDMEATDYALLLTRCLIQSRTDGMTKDFPLSNVTSRLTVEDYLMGDVNSDGSVTPSDAIMTLYNYFSVEQTGFNAKAADMNSDGSITPADAIEMLYTYFGSGRQNATRRSGEEREPQ